MYKNNFFQTKENQKRVCQLNISLRTSDIAINYIFFLKYHVQK